jgi:hypothetical protein|tara:strand:- start:1917 stop:2081 length:165 start_codon:yes stop_codon:yes gene_type:complete
MIRMLPDLKYWPKYFEETDTVLRRLLKKMGYELSIANLGWSLSFRIDTVKFDVR